MKRGSGCFFVVAALALFVGVFLFFPAITAVRTRTQYVQLGSRMRCIFMAIYDAQLEADAVGSGENYFPQAGEYASSTDFLRAITTNGIIKGIDFSFYDWKSHSHHNYHDPAEFTKKYNAWCVVEGLSSNTPPDTPFIFSRNFGFGPDCESPVPGMTLDMMSGLNKKEKPLGNKAGVVITKCGTVRVLNRLTANQSVFNPGSEKLKILVP
jgi:hypothetical protein